MARQRALNLGHRLLPGLLGSTGLHPTETRRTSLWSSAREPTPWAEWQEDWPIWRDATYAEITSIHASEVCSDLRLTAHPGGCPGRCSIAQGQARMQLPWSGSAHRLLDYFCFHSRPWALCLLVSQSARLR